MLATTKKVIPVQSPDDLIAETVAGYPRMVSPAQAAEILGVHHRHVHTMIERGELAAVKLRQTQRGGIRIPMASIVALLRLGMGA